jgi:hypothetical protein
MLHTLPFIEDHRKDKDFNLHGWRFLYSHSFSLKKKLFIKSGGFDVNFGDVWGYEDMELGYRLYLQGAEFCFLKESPSFHQPHKSNCENTSLKRNISLFLRKHNSYLIELACSYGFEIFYEILSKWEHVEPSNYDDFQVILGVVNNSIEKNVPENRRLGIITPFDNKSKKKVFLKKEILKFPKEITLQILIESERIGKRLFIDRLVDKEFLDLQELFTRIGYKIKILNLENIDELLLTRTKNCVSSIVFPNLEESEKRFVYKWMAVSLQKKHVVQVFDLQNNDNSAIENISLPHEDNILLDNMFIPYFSTNGKICISIQKFANISGNPLNRIQTIVDDADYYVNSDILNQNSYNIIDKYEFSILTFTAAYHYTKSYKEKYHQPSNCVKNNYLCFMENGFLEDGIDVILEAFEQLKISKKKLTIKIADYDALSDKSFRLHNKEAIKLKTYNQKQKINKDLLLLKLKINELKLNDSVTVLMANYSIYEIMKLISTSSKVIWTSIGLYVAPEIYLAILLGKTVILSSHHIIPEELKNSTLICDSKEEPLSQKLNLPNTLDLLYCKAYSTDKNSLLENFYKVKTDNLLIDAEMLACFVKRSEVIIEKCIEIIPCTTGEYIS